MAKRKAKQLDIFTDRADDTPLFSKSPMAADSSEFAPAPVASQPALFPADFEELAKGARAKRDRASRPAGDDTADLPLFASRDNDRD
jgi:hypothetical protein